jgi:hypothetical protein
VSTAAYGAGLPVYTGLIPAGHGWLGASKVGANREKFSAGFSIGIGLTAQMPKTPLISPAKFKQVLLTSAVSGAVSKDQEVCGTLKDPVGINSIPFQT